MLGIVGCTLVASYLVAALFALVRTWEAGNHSERRLSARDTGRVVWEAAVWPLEELWLRLRQYFSEQWAQAIPRWQGVAS
jgi:hypothetical protein